MQIQHLNKNAQRGFDNQVCQSKCSSDHQDIVENEAKDEKPPLQSFGEIARGCNNFNGTINSFPILEFD
jgi:hypothetical protein